MKTETHTEQKKRHSEEIGSFEGLFFAFNNEQLKEGMDKIGLAMNDVSLICSIGAGGYMIKDKVKSFKELLKRHNEERRNRLKDEKALLQSLIYELNNHEYCYTGDPADALESLGLTLGTVDQKVLNKAIRHIRSVEVA